MDRLLRNSITNDIYKCATQIQWSTWTELVLQTAEEGIVLFYEITLVSYSAKSCLQESFPDACFREEPLLKKNRLTLLFVEGLHRQSLLPNPFELSMKCLN